jgi:tight adherence protein B
MDMSSIWPVIAALLGFVALAGVGWVLVGEEPTSAKANKRISAVATDTKSEAARGRTTQDTQAARRKQILLTLKQQENQDRKAKLSLQSRLIQAGLSLTVRDFWIGSGIIGIVSVVIALLLRAPILAAIGIGFAAGLGLPRWLLSTLAKGRSKKFTEEFPNAIDIIVRGIKSGLPVHDCMRLIAAESPEPLANEFKKLMESIAVGTSIDQALEKMYDRMPTSEVRFFSIVLAIQQKTGGNLAEALNNLSVVLRARKLLREKIKALSGEAVASAFIIGSLPPGIGLMVTVTSPGYMNPLVNDPRGHVILGIGIGMELLGIFVMRRMINFKF